MQSREMRHITVLAQQMHSALYVPRTRPFVCSCVSSHLQSGIPYKSTIAVILYCSATSYDIMRTVCSRIIGACDASHNHVESYLSSLTEEDRSAAGDVCYQNSDAAVILLLLSI